MEKVLFIASTTERYYYEPFVAACRLRNIEVYVFDPQRVPTTCISLRMDATGHLVGFLDVLTFTPRGDVVTRIAIEDVALAWYIRENRFRENKQTESATSALVRTESRCAVTSLMSVLDCVCG